MRIAHIHFFTGRPCRLCMFLLNVGFAQYRIVDLNDIDRTAQRHFTIALASIHKTDADAVGIIDRIPEAGSDAGRILIQIPAIQIEANRIIRLRNCDRVPVRIIYADIVIVQIQRFSGKIVTAVPLMIKPDFIRRRIDIESQIFASLCAIGNRIQHHRSAGTFIQTVADRN